MNGFDWDAPGHTPPSSKIEVGQSVTGTITALAIQTNLRGDPTLTYTLDGGNARWCNRSLWRTFAQLRPAVGDTVTITRLPDEPGQGQYPKTNWRVERHDTPAPSAPPPAQQPAPGLQW